MRKLAFAATVLIALHSPAAARAQMKAHFINVGQAQSVLLEFATAAVLVDAGGEDTGDNRDLDHLLQYLNTFFTGRPDLNRTLHSVIVSHPHIDHTRHLVPVLENFTVRNLIDGGDVSGSGIQQFRDARRLADKKGIIYNKVPDTRISRRGYRPFMLRTLKQSASDVDIRFLAGSRRACEDANNGSLAVLVTYREATILLPGDAENEDDRCEPEIQRLIERFGSTLLDVDVYAVGHHGSRNGTSTDYLTVMSPELSVISAGHHTTRTPGQFHAFQFGHPRESAVAMIESATTGTRSRKVVYSLRAVRDVLENRVMEKAVYCTCWDGDVVVEVDSSGSNVAVRTSTP